MAPAAAEARRKARDPQYVFDLGVRGRKTGLTLPDTGIRDEHGLEPIDGLFSSPAKPTPKSSRPGKTNGASANATLSSSEDMDTYQSTIPEPADVLIERKRTKLPPPRSKSPIKTHLQSPARRNPSHGPRASPGRPSVIRRLDFSAEADDLDRSSHESLPNPSSRAGRPDGTRLPPALEDTEADETAQTQDDTGIEDDGDSLQQVDYGYEEPEEPEEPEGPIEESEVVDEPEPEPEPEPEVLAKTGRKKKTAASASMAPQAEKRGRGRPPGKPRAPPHQTEEDEGVEELGEEQADEERPTKRRRFGRTSLEFPAQVSETTKGPSKKKGGRPKKTQAVHEEVAEDPKEKPKKPIGRKPKSANISELDSPEVRRGPPMPRNSRGLLILRRETPSGSGGFQRTRSGRNSIKPLAYWRGERVEWDESGEATDGDAKFLLPTIKEVVRTEETAAAAKRSQKKGKRGKKRAADSDSEDDDEMEPWEVEPGRIVGEIREWDPEDPLGQDAPDKEEELALSSAAIITREIAGATFKFAKTLTLPFFGSGMVDLPPGAVKKPKNSRKMQMVFFVHFGRVEVSINDNVFRIGKGGMWQVPRGNFYSITNDYDKPARIFFSQGNEVEPGASDALA